MPLGGGGSTGGGPASQLDAAGDVLDVGAIGEGEVPTRVGNTLVGTAAGGGEQVADFQLTNDQILNLRASEVELLLEPGAGKAYSIRKIHAVLDQSAGAYTHPGTSEMDIGFSGYWHELFVVSDGGAGIKVITGSLDGQNPDYFQIAHRDYSNLLLLDNLAFCVGNVGDTELGGGNVANTLSIRLWYSILPTVPFV